MLSTVDHSPVTKFLNEHPVICKILLFNFFFFIFWEVTHDKYYVSYFMLYADRRHLHPQRKKSECPLQHHQNQETSQFLLTPTTAHLALMSSHPSSDTRPIKKA